MVGKKKLVSSTRRDRVPKFCLTRHKINQKPSLSRNASGNENTRSSSQQRISLSSGSYSRRSYFGLFRQWTCKNQENSSVARDSWEKGTVSILKGENILSKSDGNISAMDDNKNFVKNVPCLNLHTFDLNKLLPEINASCSDTF